MIKVNISSNGIKGCLKDTVPHCVILAKNAKPESTHEEKIRDPNWGITYKITCLYSSKVSGHEIRKDRGPTKDTWQLNTASVSEQDPFAVKDIIETIRETWVWGFNVRNASIAFLDFNGCSDFGECPGS